MNPQNTKFCIRETGSGLVGFRVWGSRCTVPNPSPNSNPKPCFFNPNPNSKPSNLHPHTKKTKSLNRSPPTSTGIHQHIVCICLMWLKPEPQPQAQIHETCCMVRVGYLKQGALQDTAGRRLPEQCREGSHRPRKIFVSIVARSCRKPLQRWNLDRKGTLSGGIPSSTNDLRFHRGPIMSEAIPTVEPRPEGQPVGRDPIVHE